MIEVQHVTKHYGRVAAVNDVSFRVERGEILGAKLPLIAAWMPSQRELVQLESKRVLLKKLLRQLPRQQHEEHGRIEHAVRRNVHAVRCQLP